MKQYDTVQAVQAAETPRFPSLLHPFARLHRSLDPILTSSNSGYGFLLVAGHEMTWRSTAAHSPIQYATHYVEYDPLSCQTTHQLFSDLVKGRTSPWYSPCSGSPPHRIRQYSSVVLKYPSFESGPIRLSFMA